MLFYFLSSLSLTRAVAQPSQVGVSLSSIGFNSFFDNVLIGPVASTGPVTLLPNTTSPLPLAGRLIEQTSDQGLGAISSVFNNFIHGIDSDVTVKGTAAGPSSVMSLRTVEDNFLTSRFRQLGSMMEFKFWRSLLFCLTRANLTLSSPLILRN